MKEQYDLGGLLLQILGALGGAGVVLFGLAHYLGQRWSERYLANIRATHDRELADRKAVWERQLANIKADQETELAKLRAELTHQSEATLAEIRATFEVETQKHLRGFHDKLEIYRASAASISNVLGDMDTYFLSGNSIPSERLDAFNRERINAYAHIAMIAPQSVMDAFDELADHLIRLCHRQLPYKWEVVREKSLVLLNEIRKDIAIDKSQISYNGTL